jgi:hypothetical protein
MNAVKALLVANSITLQEHHGVRAKDLRSASKLKRVVLANEGVKIGQGGILAQLANHLGDAETSTEHTLKDILFNLPFVHRTYCLTFRSQRDLFYALTDCAYVFDDTTGDAYLSARLSRDFADRRYHKRLPASFRHDPADGDVRAVRSIATVAISSPLLRSQADIEQMKALNRRLREDLQYIAGSQTLWYLKGVVGGGARLARSPLTLTLAAMHRLSEICRYRPFELDAFLKGQYNWLLTEFVLMAPDQFLDGIASELTGHQFLLPSVRAAT